MGRMAHRRRLVPSSMPERFCRVALSLLLAVPQTLIPVAAFAETPAAVDYSKLTPPVGEADWAARLELLKKRYSQLLVEAAKRLAAEDSATGAAAACSRTCLGTSTMGGHPLERKAGTRASSVFPVR